MNPSFMCRPGGAHSESQLINFCVLLSIVSCLLFLIISFLIFSSRGILLGSYFLIFVFQFYIIIWRAGNLPNSIFKCSQQRALWHRFLSTGGTRGGVWVNPWHFATKEKASGASLVPQKGVGGEKCSKSPLLNLL